MGSRFENVTDYERNLSPMILKANKWYTHLRLVENQIISWVFRREKLVGSEWPPSQSSFEMSRNAPPTAAKTTRFWTQRAWNYSLISLVTVWLPRHIHLNYIFSKYCCHCHTGFTLLNLRYSLFLIFIEILVDIYFYIYMIVETSVYNFHLFIWN